MARKAKSKEPTKTIEQILWDSANELRGNLDAAEYIGDGIFFVPADARWDKIVNAALTAEIGVVVDAAIPKLMSGEVKPE